VGSCFALGCPTRPVYRGEMQCRGLGMAVDIFDDAGRPVRGERGELVCTAPFPSMPVGFWNDPTGAKYRAAYFERFPGVWCHGDYAALTEHDGVVIYGRSDAVLNPGGVRIGTAEIYAAVESLPQILEALAVAQDWQGDVRIVLFVRLQNGAELAEALVAFSLDDLEEDRTDDIAREDLQQHSLALLRIAIDQDAAAAQLGERLPMAGHAGGEVLIIGVGRVLERDPVPSQHVHRAVDVLGREGDVLDALAVILAQVLLDLALVVLRLVDRDADLAARTGHGARQEPGALALDVEL